MLRSARRARLEASFEARAHQCQREGEHLKMTVRVHLAQRSKVPSAQFHGIGRLGDSTEPMC